MFLVVHMFILPDGRLRQLSRVQINAELGTLCVLYSSSICGITSRTREVGIILH